MTLAEDIHRDLVSSGGAWHEMTHQQIAALRDHLTPPLDHVCTDSCRGTHFWDFAYLIGGCDVLHRPLHGPVCELMERWGSDDWRRIMVQLPRGALKSTICTRTGALWRLCRDQNTTVVIFNEKIERVQKWLLAIQSIVAGNPVFHMLYRELIPPGIARGDPRPLPKGWKWSTSEMMFVRSRHGIPEASLTAMSVGGASAGGHWEWIFHDDLISVEAQQSRVVMKQVKDWFDTSVYLGLSPESMNAWISCTRWHYDDVYEYARKYHGFKLYRRAALENGETSFPRSKATKGLGWTTGQLLDYQRTRPLPFNAQMQNAPAAGEDTAFKTEDVRRAVLATNEWDEEVVTIRKECYDPAITLLHEEEAPRTVPLSAMHKIVLVDPAPTTDTERKQDPDARTAIVVKGVDAWGRRFWLDVWAGREDPISEMGRMLGMMQKWGTDRIGVEEVVFSKLYGVFLRDMAGRAGLSIRYQALKPGRRDKGTRIAGLARSFAGGWEYVLPEAEKFLMDELTTYPYGRTVDILDASAYDRDPGVLTRPESPDERDFRIAREHAPADHTGRDPVVGY